MPTTTQVTTYFSFKDSRTGELVRLYSPSDYAGYELSDDPSLPVFSATHAEHLELILRENTPRYNATAMSPGWGPFKAEHLVPVHAQVTTTLEELPRLKLPLVHSHHVRNIPYVVARRYAGGDLPGHNGQDKVTFWLVILPEDVTFDEARTWEGEKVFGGDKYTRRIVYRVLPVPEDYQGLVAGKNAALFLASDLVF